jgi:putative oxidoreductase
MSAQKNSRPRRDWLILTVLSGDRPLPGWADAVLFAGRLASACVFISFGLAKFVSHASETASFRDYGLPAPSAFAYVIGAIEVCGGIALLLGFATRLVACVLAGDMVGAIVASGILSGETVSLTLAPALLVFMLVVVFFGAGALSLDRRIVRRIEPRSPGTPP